MDFRLSLANLSNPLNKFTAACYVLCIIAFMQIDSFLPTRQQHVGVDNQARRLFFHISSTTRYFQVSPSEQM